MLGKLSPTFRLSTGLVFLTLSIFMSGEFFGLIPSPYQAALETRKKFCETVAMQLSLAASRRDYESIERAVELIVDRDEKVLSASFVTSEGTIIAQTADHRERWSPLENGKSTPTQVQVPIFKGEKQWGAVQIAFTDLVARGFLGLITHPTLKMAAFVGTLGFFAYYFFMRRSLRHLDPTAVVPSRVKNTLDALNEGVVLLDRNRQIILANQVFSDCVSSSPSRLVGTEITSFPWRAAPEPGSEQNPWDRTFAAGEAVVGDSLLLDAGGRTDRFFSVNSSPIKDDQGRVRGALVTFDDMTDIQQKNADLNQAIGLLEKAKVEVEQKNLELRATNQIIERRVEERTEELVESRDAAESANRAKSEFLANISHELRTPMHAILSFSQFGIKKIDKVERDRIVDYFQRISTSGSQLLFLLNDLLDLSKLQAGKMEYEMRVVDVTPFVEEIASELSGLAEEKGIELRLDATPGLPPCRLDEFRIKQVIRNVLSNAIKFTEAGGAAGMRTSLGEEAGRPVIEIDIWDEGVGIPAAEIDTIFEPFLQGQRTASGAGGTGLGLSISREIMTAHGGTIRVRSRPERGTVFSIGLFACQEESGANGLELEQEDMDQA